MKKVIALIIFVLLLSFDVHAGDYHQNGQGQTVTVTITDSNGDPVSTQTPRVAAKRMTDGLWLDFSSNTFKAANQCTTLFQTMTFEQTGGFYYRVVSIDGGTLVSSDVIFVLSNDDATYGFTTSENCTWDTVGNLVKIHR